MTSSEFFQDDATPPISRPPFQLRLLPIRYRWEATRRHPLYILLWQLADAHHRKISTGDVMLDKWAAEASSDLFHVCGVSGEMPDPQLEFEDIQREKLNAAWLSGAVHPISLRGMASILIAYLEPSTCRSLGLLFQSVLDSDGGKSKEEMIGKLQTLTGTSLDGLPSMPLVSVNPAASVRDISRAIDTLLVQWKSERGLTQKRTRSEKFGDYLKVWDDREGWSEGYYDRAKELTLKEIASKYKRQVSTISNQYQQAFQLVTGQPYSVKLWRFLFEPLKLSELTKNNSTVSFHSRNDRTAGKKATPEGALGEFPSDYGPVKGASTTDPQAYQDLCKDIRDLLSKGKSDAYISDATEIPADAIFLIRRRFDENPNWFVE